MQLSGISIYPVKSCAGLDLPQVSLDRFGPEGDRRWLVTDPRGRFISQRECAEMALISALPVPAGLQLGGSDGVEVPVPADGARERWVQVWEDRLMARDAGDGAAAWLSQRLGRDCRLFYMPDSARRRVDGLYAREGETVSFADGFPLLLISEASLEDLNGRLPQPVPMNRFRPNLVVSGAEPFAEDGWRRIRIGAVELQVAKPCSRCVIPSIDQATAQRDGSINRVLASYRRQQGQVYFGQNLLYRETGTLQLGDEVQVLE